MSLRVSLPTVVATLALAACSGGDGALRPSLSRVDPGAPAATCPGGGSTVSRGLDDDGDGILDDAEVDVREHVCNEVPPSHLDDVLTARSDEPAGVRCPQGGTRVDSGLDRDQDGRLAPEEIDTSEYECRGASEPTELTSVAVEPAGENCELGGVAVHTGADLDDDGVLEDAEIDATRHVCDSPAPPPAPPERSELAFEPAGARCAAGGTVLHTGRDDDGDGQLDAEEIERSDYRCGGVLEGNYVIDSQEAADALAGIQVITGTLIVDPTEGLSAHHDIALADLRFVGGDVVSDEPLYLDSFAAPELVHVGGNLQMNSYQRIHRLTLPRLAVVGGHVFVMSLEMDGIALPALERVGGMLNATVGGTAVDLTALRTVGGVLEVHSHTEHLVMPALVAVGGLDLAGTPDLVELRAPQLARVERRMRLGGNELATLDLSRLTVVGGDLQIHETPIATLSLPQLEIVGGELLVFYQPTTAIDLPRLRAVSKLDLSYLDITTLNLPALEEADEIEILRNDELVSIAATRLRTVGSLTLSHLPALVDLTGLAGLAQVEGVMTIASCAALVDLTAFADLEAVGVLSFGGNDALVSLGAPALRTVHDYLEIGLPPVGNLALERVDLPALAFANAMIIQGNHALTQLQMPALAQIVSVLRVHYNAALPACVVDAFHAALTHKPADYDPYRNDGVCPL